MREQIAIEDAFRQRLGYKVIADDAVEREKKKKKKNQFLWEEKRKKKKRKEKKTKSQLKNLPECFGIETGDVLNVPRELALEELEAFVGVLFDVSERRQRAVRRAWIISEMNDQPQSQSGFQK